MSTNSDENIAWGWEGNWGLVPVAVHWKIWKYSPLCCIAVKCNIESAAGRGGGKNIFKAAQRVWAAVSLFPAGDFGGWFWGYFNVGKKWWCRREVKRWVSGTELCFWFEIEDWNMYCWDFSMYTRQSCLPLSCLPLRCISRISWYIQWDGRSPLALRRCGDDHLYTYTYRYTPCHCLSHIQIQTVSPPLYCGGHGGSLIYTNIYLIPPVIVCPIYSDLSVHPLC